MVAEVEGMVLRVEGFGQEVEERITSEEYLALVRKAFREWDEADTEQKRRLLVQLISAGATANDVGSAIVSATASSRFVAPNYWRDPKSGVSYQVQVQVPQPAMTSLKDVQSIPINGSAGAHLILS